MLKVIIGALASLFVVASAQATVEEVNTVRLECQAQKLDGTRFLIAVEFGHGAGLKIKNEGWALGAYRPADLKVTALNGPFAGQSVEMETEFLKRESDGEDMTSYEFTSVNKNTFAPNGYIMIQNIAENFDTVKYDFLDGANWGSYQKATCTRTVL